MVKLIVSSCQPGCYRVGNQAAAGRSALGNGGRPGVAASTSWRTHYTPRVRNGEYKLRNIESWPVLTSTWSVDSVARTSQDSDQARFRLALEKLFRSENAKNYVRGRLAHDKNSRKLVHVSALSDSSFQVRLEEKSKNKSKNSNGDKGSGRSEDFYANVGYAIRTLREDIPLLFLRDLNYEIYRDDIVFKDPRNTFKGIDNYKLIFWSLRFHGKIFFRSAYVEIKRLWQTEDNCIRMRWTVHGFPRVPWEAEGTFDGVSEFRLDRDGKIYSHAVDNVIFRDPPGERLPIFSLNFTPVGQQQPVPGGWCSSERSACTDLSWAEQCVAHLSQIAPHDQGVGRAKPGPSA
uniref:Uncharacterized protein n=1 Tax=Tetraselmis sp. GSL018 TaxID=582737 RepID=A0A061R745_9CHLO|mmetsp:Transcript_38514/g.91320  ORF Transcript_38514/g.91320 Transcript_38514/m.91320 type:complete len:347 (+) Transcript_38514:299-1339(+)